MEDVIFNDELMNVDENNYIIPISLVINSKIAK